MQHAWAALGDLAPLWSETLARRLDSVLKPRLSALTFALTTDGRRMWGKRHGL